MVDLCEYSSTCFNWVSLVAQMVKNPPAVQKTWVQSLRWEDPIEKGMATHFSILAWRIPKTEEPTVHKIAKNQTRLSNEACTLF